MNSATSTVNGHTFVLRWDNEPQSVAAALDKCDAMLGSESPVERAAAVELSEVVIRFAENFAK
jgi:hypothetical protein